MLRQRPKSDDLFETTNTYRYVDNQLISYGPVYRIRKDEAGTWAVLRYLLESNRGTCANHATYVTGHTLDRRLLQASDPIPDLVLVRRHAMPRGVRQYVPPDVNRRYIIAEAELATCKIIMEEASHNFLTDSDNYEHHNQVYAETLERSRKLHDAMQDIRRKCGSHASELVQHVSVTSPHPGVWVTQTVAVPPSSYVCSVCQLAGKHFRDLCDTDLTTRSTELVWGAAKMKRLTNK